MDHVYFTTVPRMRAVMQGPSVSAGIQEISECQEDVRVVKEFLDVKEVQRQQFWKSIIDYTELYAIYADNEKNISDSKVLRVLQIGYDLQIDC